MVLLLSIVIPAFNEEKMLSKALGNLYAVLNASLFESTEFEVIVCDNNSTDGTSKIATSFDARVVFEEKNQIAIARNTGAKAARGAWLLFMDADSYPGIDLINEVHETILNDQYAGVGSTMRYFGEAAEKLSFFLMLVNIWMRINNSAAGAFLGCRTKDFHAVGGFDTQLYVAEDLDLAKRLKSVTVASRKKFKILSNNPFYTSARKFELYTGKERRRLYRSVLFGGRKTFRDKSKLSLWYDGRR